MRNLIIITSLVFIAIVVTSYFYFANLEGNTPPMPIDTEVAEEETVLEETVTEEMAPDDAPVSLRSVWAFKLNAKPTNKPAVFSDDDANRFILVQDAYHILYAISANGEKRWNAQLPGPIVGEIQQLGDGTLVFTTAERLYRIDTDGDPLPGFSLTLPQKATPPGATASQDESPESVHISVQTGSRVLSYDGRGNLKGRGVSARSRQADTERDSAMLLPSAESLTGPAADCGPFSYYGPLQAEDGNYLLCAQDDGTLQCYRL